jgi:hypothetical protein
VWILFSSWQGTVTVVTKLEKVGETALSKAGSKLQHPSLIQPPPPLIVMPDAAPHQKEKNQQSSPSASSSSSSSFTTVSEIRAAFHQRYDTAEQTADDMLAKAVARFGSLQHTATRLLKAAAAADSKNKVFHMGFAGYSVTVGRGNHLEESFPYIVRDLLQPLFLAQLDGLQLHVRNAAIGGIPSFPYAFCLSHFLGKHADVVSWDYSMNEQGKSNTAALEAYIRHAQRQMQQHDGSSNNNGGGGPLMIVLDNHVGRCNLLQDYATRGLLGDALCLHKPEDAVDNKSLLDKSGSILHSTILALPEGFQHWDEFGAPPNCPGRGNWHPRKQEHAWMGWMIAMYFVDALELAVQMMHDKPDDWKTLYGRPLSSFTAEEKGNGAIIKFPPPLSKELPENDADVTDLMFGHKVTDKNDYYILKEVSCRTNFLPASDHDNVLPQIVVSGLSPEATADDIIQERSDDVYRQGWVLDVSSVERKTKVKVEECGGLGYVDMKIAIYGVPESGVLRLWLPVESTHHTDAAHQDHDHQNDEYWSARHWFDTLVICEANEKRSDNACQLDKDLEYTVGGVTIPSTGDNAVKMLVGYGEYLKRPTCAHVGIPANAKMTSLADLKTTEGHDVDDDVRMRLSSSSHHELGLIVDLQAKPNVSRKNGACCVSHIVWEQH